MLKKLAFTTITVMVLSTDTLTWRSLSRATV